MHEDEKKPPVGGVVGESAVWRVYRMAPTGEPGRIMLRIEADSAAARELLGDLDVCGQQPVKVAYCTGTAERCPQTGAFHTTGLTLLLTQ